VGLLILEALLALALLVGIVAWTMAGRRREPPGSSDDGAAEAAQAAAARSPQAAGAGEPAQPENSAQVPDRGAGRGG
jgi:hypothetical protein